MGFFRILLASLVLASHAHVAPVFSGALAVQAFFIISGFYMQMVIREQYADQPHWRRRFWMSRALRIFVPYWTILLAITIYSYAMRLPLGKGGSDWLTMDWRGVLANIFIFGTETIKLNRAEEGFNPSLWVHIVVPQVWSVGMELMFYVLAPFLLVCRSRVLFIICLACATGKYVLLHNQAMGIFKEFECGDGLLNGIFPLELGVFLSGSLGYRFYLRYLTRRSPGWWEYPACLALLSMVTAMALEMLTGSQQAIIGYHAYILAVIVLVPFLFRASRALKWDRTIGDMSYPFYLCHYFLLMFCQQATAEKYTIFFEVEDLSLLAACLVTLAVDRPLDRMRHAYFRARTPCSIVSEASSNTGSRS